MTDPVDPRHERDLTAAELALGLLDGEARADAQRQLLRDPAFRAEYEFWAAKAGDWLENVPPAEDAPDLWAGIEAAIAEGTGAEGLAEPARRTGGFAVVWAAAATLAAVVAIPAAVHFQQRDAAARQENATLARQVAMAEGERQVAQIVGESSQVLVSALYNPSSGTIDLKLEMPSEGQLVPELWVVPSDGKPRSLGTFTTASARFEVQPSIRPFLTDGATLAVTMEPADGAPHAAPTGPIIGATTLKSI